MSDLIRRLGHERTVGLAVAVIVLAASVLSVAPAASTGPTSARTGDIGGPTGDGPVPRLVVGGAAIDPEAVGNVEEAYAPVDGEDAGSAATEDAPRVALAEPAPGVSALTRMGDVDMNDPSTQAVIAAADRAAETDVEGPFLDDGTLLKPVAVDTTVADGSDLLRTYKVKAGDTLTGIANKFDVSMMTIWWANKLKSKDDLHLGQVLTIPPVTGLVVEVKSGDTLTSIADRYGDRVDDILEQERHRRSEPRRRPGPRRAGRQGQGHRDAEADQEAVNRRRPAGCAAAARPRPPRTYDGGNFLWPTSNNYISQYYHYGHYGLDIDGATGDPSARPPAARCIFAGWKSNGGGYQVWIAHGSGLYTTYNHMSGVTVGRGQNVGRGQQVGRIGQSGNATGPHLHFEVWKGPIWDGGRASIRSATCRARPAPPRSAGPRGSPGRRARLPRCSSTA